MNDVAPQGAGLEEVLRSISQLATTSSVRGILAAPATSTPAAMTLEGLNLEVRESHALPAAKEKEAATRPPLFLQEGPVR